MKRSSRYGAYHFVGRWFERRPGFWSTITPGASAVCRVSGTRNIDVCIQIAPRQSMAPAIAWSVDGSPFRRAVCLPDPPVVGEHRVPVEILADPKPHVIRLVVSGIRETDPLWMEGAGLHFGGLVVDAGGMVEPAPTPDRYVLFLGDSITAGINALGRGSVPAVNAAEAAYPRVASDRLGLACYPVAFGAIGITRGGNGGVPLASEVLDYHMHACAVGETPAPAAVVINLGTNDRSADSRSFADGYRAYLRIVRGRYPFVPVLCMRPFVGCFAEEIAAAAEEAGGIYVDTTDWDVSTSDGVHPDPSGHQTAGRRLVEVLRGLVEA